MSFLKGFGVAFAAVVALAFIACGESSGGDSSSSKKMSKGDQFLEYCVDTSDYEGGSPSDPKKCKELTAQLEKECDKDKDGDSCFILGYEYDPKEDMPTFPSGYDAIKALNYFTKGCDYGNGSSCQALAYEYEFGKKDYAKAIELNNKALDIFEKKCNEGSNYNSCYAGANMHYEREDFHKALKMYKTYCDNKDTTKHHACIRLGEMYMKGQGTTQNFDEAKKYFKIVCDAGYQDGCDEYRKVNEKQNSFSNNEKQNSISNLEKIPVRGTEEYIAYVVKNGTEGDSLLSIMLNAKELELSDYDIKAVVAYVAKEISALKKTANPKLVSYGKLVYQEKCVACHLADGTSRSEEGGEPMARDLTIYGLD